MRLWSIHPSYLDKAGLVALWREALLAQKVLSGETKGYINHPQLTRFKSHKNPIAAIGYYLNTILIEAAARQYTFNCDKILEKPSYSFNEKITVNSEQLLFEMEHLKQKITKRSPKDLSRIKNESPIIPNPLFQVIIGAIESWEKI